MKLTDTLLIRSSSSHSMVLRGSGLAALVIVVFGICTAGCADRDQNPVNEPDREAALIQLNWYPESEHGGVFAAKAAGFYDAEGVELTVRGGGPGTRVAPELASGRVQFAFANADDVVLFREAGVDVVAVLAAMQNHPRCILVRADSGVESFDDLKEMILQRQPGRPFVDFLEQQGVLDGVQLVPYSGSVAGLVSSKNTAIQAYSFAEPLLAQQQGVEVRTLMVSDLGWNPYSSVLVTTRKLIEEEPDLVRKVVHATQEGWRQYLTDPEPGNQLILAENEQGMTEEVLKFGYEGLKTLAMPKGVALEQVGRMSQSRWEELVDQMIGLGLVDPANVRAADCFTNDFLLPSETDLN